MQRSGIRMPASSMDWVYMDIPESGGLGGEVSYYKHGAGCEVKFSNGLIDFDFGEMGEVGGFDVWRLTIFAGDKLSDYGFSDSDSLRRCVDSLAAAGALTQSIYGQYYISSVDPLYAIDVDGRSPGDNLPLKSQDPILSLYTIHFQAADLMRENYEKLCGKWEKNNHLGLSDRIKVKIYMSSWLGYLNVVCEGFWKLSVGDLLRECRPERFKDIIHQYDVVEELFGRHIYELKGFRNNLFHPRQDMRVVRDFFNRSEDRISWAHELHKEIARFFSSYRVNCEVHCALQGRLSELDIRQSRVRRRRQTES